MHPSRLRSRPGFALLAAMWLVVIITTIALELGLQAHERRVTTIDVAERAQARAAAVAGIETERARLTQILQNPPTGFDMRFPQLSTYDALRGPDSGRVGNATFITQVRNGGEWLNVNTMSADMWRQFLIGAGLDYDNADRLSQAIEDWRDPDDYALPRGAERDAYLQMHALVLPRNASFTSVSELRNVLGMTPEIYARIVPYLSVCTSGHIDLDAAARPVLYAMPGFNEEIVETILAQRMSFPFNGGSLNGLETRVSASARASIDQNKALIQRVSNFSTPWEYIVVSTGWSPGGHTHVTMKASISPGAPEWITTWTCEE
jgi:general secretion pathway protein K